MLVLISVMAVLAIGATAWLFLIQKNFVFIVETECDPATQTCFYRDCSNEDDCPINGLENYKVFSMDAKEFYRCKEDSCKASCESGNHACTETVCGESEEDECSVIEAESSTEDL